MRSVTLCECLAANLKRNTYLRERKKTQVALQLTIEHGGPSLTIPGVSFQLHSIIFRVHNWLTLNKLGAGMSINAQSEGDHEDVLRRCRNGRSADRAHRKRTAGPTTDRQSQPSGYRGHPTRSHAQNRSARGVRKSNFSMINNATVG